MGDAVDSASTVVVSVSVHSRGCISVVVSLGKVTGWVIDVVPSPGAKHQMRAEGPKARVIISTCV